MATGDSNAAPAAKPISPHTETASEQREAEAGSTPTRRPTFAETIERINARHAASFAKLAK
jgi:hypothetical protein